MYMNTILILSLFISAYSTPTLTLRYSNGKDLVQTVLYKDYDDFPGNFQCSTTVVPDLPQHDRNCYRYLS